MLFYFIIFLLVCYYYTEDGNTIDEVHIKLLKKTKYCLWNSIYFFIKLKHFQVFYRYKHSDFLFIQLFNGKLIEK